MSTELRHLMQARQIAQPLLAGTLPNFRGLSHGEVVGGVAGCGATPPSLYFCVARILPSMAVLCCAHKIITTFGRDKLPGTEKSGACVLVGADEQGVSAAAARSWRRQLRVFFGLHFDA